MKHHVLVADVRNVGGEFCSGRIRTWSGRQDIRFHKNTITHLNPGAMIEVKVLHVGELQSLVELADEDHGGRFWVPSSTVVFKGAQEIAA